MGGMLKIIFGLAILLVGYLVWQYGFSSEDTGEKMTGGASALVVTEEDRVKGEATAPATLIEYTDFQCPACGAYHPIVDQLSRELSGKLRVVVRHYPLMQIHKNALPAARAAEAAHRQGKFFEMHDLLFVNQKEWSNADDPTKSIFPAYANRLGLDAETFRKDMADPALDEKINRDRESGNELNIPGTPSFFLNGKKLENPKSLEDFKESIESAVGL